MPQEQEAIAPISDEPESSLPECHRCGCECNSETGDIEHGDEHYCQDCHDSSFTECGHCDEATPNSSVVNARNAVGSEIQICPSCHRDTFSTCRDCSNVVHDDATRTLNGRTICDTCFDEDYFTCSDCNREYHNDNYGEDGRCVNCEYEEEDGPILDYGATPNCKPIGKGPHYYGVELEVECSCDAGDKAQDILNLLGDFAIVKHDGSLNSGFEIVTRPASLELQLKNWKKFFNDVPNGLTSFNTSTCGLHVHCSRAPLTALTIGRILLFVNTREHHGFIERVAGRAFGRWGQYNDKGLKDGAKAARERYEAVNLMNSHTIEFRIFKGTLKESSVYKAIEFCDALIHFCQPWQQDEDGDAPKLDEWVLHTNPHLDHDSKGDLLSKFCKFVEQRRKQWPHLWGFMSAKWLGRESKESKTYGYNVIKDEQ